MDPDVLENLMLNSQHFNENFKKLIIYYNKLFRKKYRHIFFSTQFRENFQLDKLFEINNRDFSISDDNLVISNTNSSKKR